MIFMGWFVSILYMTTYILNVRYISSNVNIFLIFDYAANNIIYVLCGKVRIS